VRLSVAIYQGFQEGLKIHNIDCDERGTFNNHC